MWACGERTARAGAAGGGGWRNGETGTKVIAAAWAWNRRIASPPKTQAGASGASPAAGGSSSNSRNRTNGAAGSGRPETTKKASGYCTEQEPVLTVQCHCSIRGVLGRPATLQMSVPRRWVVGSQPPVYTAGIDIVATFRLASR